MLSVWISPISDTSFFVIVGAVVNASSCLPSYFDPSSILPSLVSVITLFLDAFSCYFLILTTIFKACPFKIPISYSYDCLASKLVSYHTP